MTSQDISELIERVRPKMVDDWCRECNGTGWLFFKDGTPWMCRCNPRRVRTIRFLALQSTHSGQMK